MKHLTQEPTVENHGIDTAETFARYFIVEDEDGSILRDDLYHVDVTWASQRGHEIAPERPFLEADSMRIPLKTLEREVRHGVTKVDR